MFLLQATHEEILASNNAYHSKKLQEYVDAMEVLKVKHSRELETAKYNYDTKLARAEADKHDAVSYNDQKHKEAVARINSDRYLDISKLEAAHEIELSRAKDKADAKEIELMAELRVANNDAELARANAAMTIKRIEEDAEARIKTAEQAANVVLGNAQVEANLVIAQGKAKGEELAYQIAKDAQEDINNLYEDIIDTLTTKIPLEQINLTQVRDLITASTANFPKSVSGNVEVKNSNSK